MPGRFSAFFACLSARFSLSERAGFLAFSCLGDLSPMVRLLWLGGPWLIDQRKTSVRGPTGSGSAGEPAPRLREHPTVPAVSAGPVDPGGKSVTNLLR